MDWLMMRQLRTASLSICNKVSFFAVNPRAEIYPLPVPVGLYRDAVQARAVKYRCDFRC